MNLNQKTELLMAIRGPRRQRQLGRSAPMRRNVIRRASGKCEVCAFPALDVLNIHHIVPVARGGESEILNLILLCPNCHAIAHLCSRILAKGIEVSTLLSALVDHGVPIAQAPKLILIGTERAIVTYAGEIIERPTDATSLQEIILRDMEPTSEPLTVGD